MNKQQQQLLACFLIVLTVSLCMYGVCDQQYMSSGGTSNQSPNLHEGTRTSSSSSSSSG
jgi:hypothetical protein